MTEPRELPHNFEVEQALLGAILMSNSAYHRVSEFLRPEHFADPLLGRLYGALAVLIERGQTVNALVLKTYAEQDEGLKAVGGAKYLAQLASASVNAFDAAGLGGVVRDLAVRRQLITVATSALAAAYAPEPEDTAAGQIERLERDLYQLAETRTERDFWSFTDLLANTIQSAVAAHSRTGKLTGISTGLAALDELLGGLHKSDLVILAGRPSMGKTALVTNIAFAAARAHRQEPGPDGKPCTVDGASVGFFSLEMSAQQLTTRILAEQAGVPSDHIRRGKLSGSEMERLLSVAPDLERLPLHVDDTPARTISGLRARARRLKRQRGLDLIVVDYLQLLEASNRKDGRVQEVSEITRGLKTLAKELDVPVLALSQLSRKVEDRTDKRPQLSDLRDSGSIEQDADVVMFVYREEYYLERGSDADRARLGSVKGLAEVHIAKQRHGPTGTAYLRFDGPTTRFSDDPNEAERRAA
jgi:replicative DNA helicase